MPFIGTFQTYNEQDPSGKPWEKEFENEEAMYTWWRDQDGHPFLSISLLGHKKKDE